MINELFGNETSAKILLYIANYEQGSPSGIAATFDMNKMRVYKQMIRLEDAGIIVGRAMGNQKVFSINPRLLFKDELLKLLKKQLDLLPEAEIDKYYSQRRRPRRTGKEL